MSLYFVASLTKPAAILAKAREIAPDGNVHEVSPDKFFVQFDGTATDLSNKLGIAEGTTGTAIVLLVTAYHGRAPKSVWEWVAQKLGAK